MLLKYGGVFIDFDYVCLKPLDELAYRYSFFAGLEPPPSYARIPITSVAMIGSVPQSPIIKK